MDGVLILLAVVVLSIPVAVIVLIVLVAGLSRRVTALEEEARAARALRAAPRPDPSVRPAGPEEDPAAAPARNPDDAAPTPWTPPADLPPADLPPAGLPPADMPPAGPGVMPALVDWLRGNWVLAVAALSLGLAGIFLVQYGAEQGLLTPRMRVLLALAFGAALVAAGEWLRRRGGDAEGPTMFLPSTFAAAGLMTLYGAVLAARHLYGMVGAEVAMGGLVAVAGLSLVLGWIYGPFLAAGGLVLAAAAPVVVGGEARTGALLYVFYGLLGLSGLGIDAVKRWGWVSALALALAYGGGMLVHAGLAEAAGLAGLVTVLALAAIAVPRLESVPTHPGPALSQSRTSPPVMIAGAAMAVGVVTMLAAGQAAGAVEQGVICALLVLLALAATVWTHRAPGLADQAAIPAAGLLIFLGTMATGYGALFADFVGFAVSAPPETAPPRTVTWLLAGAAAVSVAMAWRSARGPWPAVWAAGAAGFAPVAAVVLELFWRPAQVIGGGPWSFHALALAVLATAMAERFARADGDDRRRAAYAALAALSMVALSLFGLLSAAALTAALAVLVGCAAALDRQFGLREMRFALMAGVAVLGWRLVIDPGLPQYLDDAPLGRVWMAYGSAILAMGAALVLLPKDRDEARAVAESAGLAFAGIFASVLVWRALDGLRPPGDPDISHWSASLLGLVWALLALAQVYRLRTGGALRRMRQGLAALYAAGAGLWLAYALHMNPAAGPYSAVIGPQPFDTLSLAYLVPAVLALGLAWRAVWLPRRGLMWAVAALFGTVWTFLQIRRFWQGEDYTAPFSQPELYTYTVAMLIAGGVLLYQGIAARSGALRRIAMGLIALTVAKVFLVDTSGLTGLLRVFSFLLLGLSLAGLAWLDRWAARRAGPPTDPSQTVPPA